MCAALTEPDAALNAAVAAQRALAVESWDEVGPLRVRVALHTGSRSTAMVLYVTEVIIAHDPDHVDEFIAPDAIDHAAPSGATRGPAATRIIYRMFFAAATHLGAFMGRPPTGKQVSVPCFETPGIANGKFVEHAGGIDVGEMKSKVGVQPDGVAHWAPKQ